MRLIKINKNVLANPECIECIEQTVEGYNIVVNVYVAGRPYKLDAGQGMDKAISDFMAELDKVGDDETKQYWAG